MVAPEQTALLLIDMQMGFISPDSSLCIAQAADTIPACACALETARREGLRIFHVRREYAVDGSDVEAVRYRTWLSGGKPLSQDWPASLEAPAELAEQPGEDVVVKPRFSALFATGLAERLRKLGITTLVLAGTTTPNCIRSTCYDALSHDFNVVILEDATSSRSAKVQAANIEDMRAIGAQIMCTEHFAEKGCAGIEDVAAYVTRKTGKRR